MATLFEAIEIATIAHDGQKDKAGQPYIAHVIRVAGMAVRLGGPMAEALAWLHDVPEDHPHMMPIIERCGYPKKLMEALDAITRRPGEKYFTSYLPRVKANGMARTIKCMDIADNARPERLARLPDDEADRLKNRYEKALKFLNERR